MLTGTLIDIDDFIFFILNHKKMINKFEEDYIEKLLNEVISRRILKGKSIEDITLLKSYFKYNPLCLKKIHGETPKIFIGLENDYKSKNLLNYNKKITENLLEYVDKDWARNVKTIYQSY